jgi:fucose permease
MLQRIGIALIIGILLENISYAAGIIGGLWVFITHRNVLL